MDTSIFIRNASKIEYMKPNDQSISRHLIGRNKSSTEIYIIFKDAVPKFFISRSILEIEN